MSTLMSNMGPFMRPVSPLQALLLVQLEEGPKYGYEMFKAIKDEFEGIWEPKTGSIYPVLKSLERRGFVATEIMAGDVIVPASFHFTARSPAWSRAPARKS